MKIDLYLQAFIISISSKMEVFTISLLHPLGIKMVMYCILSFFGDFRTSVGIFGSSSPRFSHPPGSPDHRLVVPNQEKPGYDSRTGGDGFFVQPPISGRLAELQAAWVHVESTCCGCCRRWLNSRWRFFTTPFEKIFSQSQIGSWNPGISSNLRKCGKKTKRNKISPPKNGDRWACSFETTSTTSGQMNINS